MAAVSQVLRGVNAHLRACHQIRMAIVALPVSFISRARKATPCVLLLFFIRDRCCLVVVKLFLLKTFDSCNLLLLLRGTRVVSAAFANTFELKDFTFAKHAPRSRRVRAIIAHMCAPQRGLGKAEFQHIHASTLHELGSVLGEKPLGL